MAEVHAGKRTKTRRGEVHRPAALLPLPCATAAAGGRLPGALRRPHRCAQGLALWPRRSAGPTRALGPVSVRCPLRVCHVPPRGNACLDSMEILQGRDGTKGGQALASHCAHAAVSPLGARASGRSHPVQQAPFLARERSVVLGQDLPALSLVVKVAGMVLRVAVFGAEHVAAAALETSEATLP